jgi:glycosyltransferase involved in cell wall biosynthesis
MISPKVSVIMPVYNGERYIVSAIESVLAQTYKNFEIVIVNDGSTDNSREKLSAYRQLPFVQYIEQDNRGVAAARNTAIRKATGELIAFLDQDDLWLPEKLDIQVDYLRQHTDVPLVHANLGHINENGEPIQVIWPTDVEGSCFRELFLWNRIAVPTVVVRRQCLSEVGLFNENLAGSDDYDMWLRIAQRFPIGRIARVLALYRFHGKNVSRDKLLMIRREWDVISSTIERVPEVYELVGKRAVKKRVGEIRFDLGFWNMWEAQDPVAARRHYLESIKNRPLHLPSYQRYIWCSLPPQLRRALAWYRHKIMTALSSSDNPNGRSLTSDRDRGA